MKMSLFRKTSAAILAVALGGAAAHANPASAAPAKDVVIVHGALVDAVGWRAVHDILVKDGFRVTIVQEPNTGFAEDVQTARRAIDGQTGPVVLVGHSYGGSVITEAGADSKVKSLVYVSALQPDAGEASGQLLQKFAAPNNAMMAVTNRGAQEHFLVLPPAKFRANFAADVPAAEAQFLADSQRQIAEKALGAPVSVAAWRNKPSYAILTTQDHMVSPELQRWMYKRSGAKVTELAASHAVFVSQPAAVARVIEAAAK
jgi:pimeloyl-ACP methyl ester carboxylesterase